MRRPFSERGNQVSSSATVGPRGETSAAPSAARSRCLQRKAVSLVTPRRHPVRRTERLASMHRQNSGQRSIRLRLASGVPVKSLKVRRQTTQRKRRRPANPPHRCTRGLPQCKQSGRPSPNRRRRNHSNGNACGGFRLRTPGSNARRSLCRSRSWAIMRAEFRRERGKGMVRWEQGGCVLSARAGEGDRQRPRAEGIASQPTHGWWRLGGAGRAAPPRVLGFCIETLLADFPRTRPTTPADRTRCGERRRDCLPCQQHLKTEPDGSTARHRGPHSCCAKCLTAA